MRARGDLGKTEVEVRVFGAMRDLAGRPDLHFTFSGLVTVARLLGRLEQQMPQLMERLRPGIHQGYLSIFANGRRIAHPSDLEIPLADGSVVSFLPPIAGG